MVRVTPEAVIHSVAVACTAAVLVAFLIDEQSVTPMQINDPGLQISLAEEIPIPAAPPTEPARPQPQPRAIPTHRPVPAPAPAALESPLVAQIAPAHIESSLPPESSAPAQPASHASIEAQYAAALRANVDSRTAVPNSAEYRLIKPSGATQVCFTLDRNGNPSAVAVAHPSGSKILDSQAMQIVAVGHYPPFPEAAFPGEGHHLFVVTIEFRS